MGVEEPVKDAVEFLKRTPTPYISDALARHNLNAVRMWQILPMTPFKDPHDHVAGPALTMRFTPSHYKERYLESPYRHTELIESAPAGSVVVIEGYGGLCTGERAGLQAVRRGVAAIVSDGPARDVDGIKRLGLPVFVPLGPVGIKMESYASTYECVGHNVPIYVHIPGKPGAQVRRDDIVVGDNNGVVVIPKEKLSIIVKATKEIVKLEEDLEDMVKKDTPWKDIYKSVHAQKYGAEYKESNQSING